MLGTGLNPSQVKVRVGGFSAEEHSRSYDLKCGIKRLGSVRMLMSSRSRASLSGSIPRSYVSGECESSRIRAESLQYRITIDLEKVR